MHLPVDLNVLFFWCHLDVNVIPPYPHRRTFHTLDAKSQYIDLKINILQIKSLWHLKSYLHSRTLIKRLQDWSQPEIRILLMSLLSMYKELVIKGISSSVTVAKKIMTMHIWVLWNTAPSTKANPATLQSSTLNANSIYTNTWIPRAEFPTLAIYAFYLKKELAP